MMMALISILVLFPMASAMLMDSMPENPYKAACTGQLGYLYLFGDYGCGSLRFDDRIKCQCQSEAFVETTVNCIDQMIAMYSGSSSNTTADNAYMALTMTCSNYTMADLNSFHVNSSFLSPYDQKLKAGKKAGTWPASKPFVVPQKEISDSYRAFTRYDRSEYLNKRYGAVLIGYWGSLAAIQALLHWVSKVFPLLLARFNNTGVMRFYRQHFIIKHYALTDRLGVSVPQFLMVLGFAVLVVTFTFADLPVSYPSYNWMNSNAATYGTIVGQRSGVLLLYLMPLLVLFSGRNNFLQWFTGWTIGPFLTFHKWIARAVVFLLVVHGIGYSIGRGGVGRYGEMWHKAYWSWGIVGIAFGCFLLVQSMRLLRRLAYDIFVVLHIICVILFFVAGYQHLRLLEEPIGLYFFYASFAVWGLDRALRLLRVLSSGIREKALVGLEGDTLMLLIKRPSHWNLIRNPSSYVFIHFWYPNMFWQSHPFTIVGSTTSPNYLKLFCKVHNGATKMAAKMILSRHESLSTLGSTDSKQSGTLTEILQASESTPTFTGSTTNFDLIPHAEVNVLLDGPYGSFADLFEFDECLFIAGGTGITPILGYIQDSLYRFDNRLQRLRLYWAVKDDQAIERCFEEELGHLRKSGVEVNIFSSRATRLDVTEVVEQSVVNSSGPTSIMCCGPPRMTAQVAQAVANSMNLTYNYVEYYEQLISW